MADFRASIPGWLDAVKEESEAHELAFASPYDVVCGFPVRRLSLVDMCRMAQLGNPFFGNKWPSLAKMEISLALKRQAAELVAYQDIGYRLPFGMMAPIHRRRFRRIRNKVEKIDPLELYSEIIGYFERTFTDQLGADKRKSGEEPSAWSNVVEYIDLLGNEYGWTENHVINMPYRQLIQIIRKVISRTNPKAIMPKRSDAIIAEYLREKREAREKEESK